MDSRSVAVVTSPRSTRVSCFQAASMPSGTAIAAASATAVRTMVTLTLNRSSTNGSTSWWLVIEKPRSPWNSALSQIRYCTTKG
ncbi:hypothetical protein D3C76_1751910 [compost metagenome]